MWVQTSPRDICVHTGNRRVAVFIADRLITALDALDVIELAEEMDFTSPYFHRQRVLGVVIIACV